MHLGIKSLYRKTMFETITNKMSSALRRLRGMHTISESNIGDALKEVRTALLSADVHFKVVREFIETVQAACLGQSVTQSVTPGQQAVKIIHDELVKLFGEGTPTLSQERPLSILMVGLHGSGKTTSSAKLARLLTNQGLKPILVACDIYRPAAIDQLQILAKQQDCLFYADRETKDVCTIAKKAIAYAKDQGADALIFDTAGRLQIDEKLIQELKDMHTLIAPNEVLLVADSALGQEAVNVAKHFHEALGLTGIILTKLDGDARGGAALSMKAITQVPIKFMATGEKLADFDQFHPDRMAQRILGMGDVVSLVEKAQAAFDEAEVNRLAERFKKAEFTLDDLLMQLGQVKKLGSISSITKLLPGGHNLKVGDKEQERLKKTEAVLLSMTPKERQNPTILNGRRRMRIAKGSGTEVRDVNLVLSQYQDMKKMMKSMKGPKMNQLLKQMSQKGGIGMPSF